MIGASTIRGVFIALAAWVALGVLHLKPWARSATGQAQSLQVGFLPVT